VIQEKAVLRVSYQDIQKIAEYQVETMSHLQAPSKLKNDKIIHQKKQAKNSRIKRIVKSMLQLPVIDIKNNESNIIMKKNIVMMNILTPFALSVFYYNPQVSR